MVDPKQELSADDVAHIAALHVASIDDSLPTLLGEGFARALYRYLAASERELVFVERVDGRVESVCVVSFDPASLQGRILRETFAPLAWNALGAVFTRAAFRSMLWHMLVDGASGGEAHEAKAPEITYVFTNGALRGRQLGRRIVERVDAELLARGFDGYFVKTIDAPENRAVRFYTENGFDVLGPRIEGGRTFVEFRKLLAR